MIRETLEALEDSIEHWTRMHKDPLGCDDTPTAMQCALCRRFIYGQQVTEHCEGCPIKDQTGAPDCLGTGYYEARPLLFQMRRLDRDSMELGDLPGEWERASGMMLDFLKSLLPEEKCNCCGDPLAEHERDRCDFCGEAAAALQEKRI